MNNMAWKRFLTILMIALLSVNMLFASSLMMQPAMAADYEIAMMKATLTAGAKEQDNGTYVWTADQSDAEHAFIFRIMYTVNGMKDLEPGEMKVTLPGSILSDRNGNKADEFDISMPEHIEGVESESAFSYVIDGDNIVVTNEKTVSASSSNYIEIAYLTTQPTYEYKDMEELGSFQAQLSVKDGEAEADTETFPIYIDTNAEIESTTKNVPSLYYAWDDSWGTAPADANDYYYLVWEIKSVIQDPTQTYTFDLNDQVEDAELVGYRMSGEKTYSNTHSAAGLTTSGTRYDYVLTRHSKAKYKDLQSYDIKNRITATVTPEQSPEDATSAVSSRTFHHDKKGYEGETGSAVLTKEGRTTNYDLERLASGNTRQIGSLRYNMHMNAFPYQWTLDDGADSKTAANYGKNPVTFQVTDDTVYLYETSKEPFKSSTYSDDEAKNLTPLQSGDYDIDAVTYNVSIADAAFDENTNTFNKVNHEFDEKDLITWYAKVDGEWKIAAKYNLGTKEATEVDDAIVSSITDSRIVFNLGVEGYRAEMTNAYYNTMMDLNPVLRLYGTDAVRAACADSSGNTLSSMTLKNKGDLSVMDAQNQVRLKSSVVAGDYIKKIVRTSSLRKSVVTSENDKKNQRVTLSWSIKQAEQQTDANGYRSYIPQDGGKFYDLLPQGSTYQTDSVQVITEEGVLDPSEYKVTLKQNYQNSGRTMLQIDIQNAANYYEVTYTTLHTWDSLKDHGATVKNPVAYETGNDDISGGYPDDGGKLSSANKKYYNNIDPSTDDRRFIYAEDGQFLTAINDIVTSGIAGMDKKVMADDDEEWSYETTVSQGHEYQYRLRYENSYATSAKNLIFYDPLENCEHEMTDGTMTGTWKGTLTGIDVSQLEKLGAAPKVYLSRVEELHLDGSVEDMPEAADLSNRSIWIPMEEFGDLAEAKAIAVDASKDGAGKDFVLPGGGTATVILYMEAPADAPRTMTIYPEAYNEIYMSGTTITTSNEENPVYLHQFHTTVNLRVSNDLTIHKVSSANTQTAIRGVSFRLRGTSAYGNKVDRTVRTNSRGDALFDTIECGTYILQEDEGVADYLEDHTEHEVVVDWDGSITIDGKSNNGTYQLTNDPRVHTDVVIYKRNTEQPDAAVPGAVFTLKGTSDYGNDVNVELTSDAAGTVRAENLERGTYTLVEKEAPEGFYRDKGTYTVKVDANGIASVSGLEQDLQGRMIMYNEPHHSFTIWKKSSYDGSQLNGATYMLTGTSNSGETVNQTVTTSGGGFAIFDHLESGSYFLQETEAPEGYRLDNTKRSVVIQKDGTVTIAGIEADEDGNYVVYDQKMPEGQVVVTKKWVDYGTHPDERPTIHISAAKPSANQSSTSSSNQVSKLNVLDIPAQVSAVESAASLNAIPAYDALESALTDASMYANTADEEPIPVDPDATVLATGVCDTARWTITSDGVLTFSPVSGDTGHVGNSGRGWQYDSHSPDVEYVRFEGNIWIDGGGAEQFFTGLDNVRIIDLAGLDTSKVTSMNYMFSDRQYSGTRNPNNLEEIRNFNQLDLSNVTTMYRMFYKNTSNLTVDMSGMSAPKLTTMQEMFREAEHITAIDMSDMYTPSLTNMNRMFLNCFDLETFDGSNLDTSNVIDFVGVFWACTSLKKLDLSTWQSTALLGLKSGEPFDQMFGRCTALEELDISGFSMKPTQGSRMLQETHNLRKLSVGPGFWFRTDSKATWLSTKFNNTSDPYTGNWTIQSKYNMDPASTFSSANYAVAVANNFNANPRYETYYWQSKQTEITPDDQDYTSIGDHVYSPGSDDPSVLEDYLTPDEHDPYQNAGYWTQIDDNTWTYTFAVMDSSIPWYVWEENVDGYVSSNPASDPIKLANGDEEATITNTLDSIANRTYGSLTISKTVEIANGTPDPEQSFEFTITLSNEQEPQVVEGVQDFGGTVFNNGEAKVYLKDGERVTIPDIPAGTSYTVTETDTENYIPSSSGETGTIETDAESVAAYTNTYDEPVIPEVAKVDFTIEKKIAGDTDIVEAGQKFSFEISFTGLEAETTYSLSDGTEFTADERGEAIVTAMLEADGQVVVQQIPAGSKYQITEAPGAYQSSYRISDAAQAGLIDKASQSNANEYEALSTARETADEEEQVTVTFTNRFTRPIVTHQLTLQKKVDMGDDDSVDDSSYAFNVVLQGLEPNQTLTAKKGDLTIGLKADISGKVEAEYWLKDGETLVFPEIPEGVRYQFNEQSSVMKASYEVKADGDDRVLETAKNDEIKKALSTKLRSVTQDETTVYTNTAQEKGELTLTKRVTGNMASATQEFNFYVNMTNEGQPVSGTFKARRTRTQPNTGEIREDIIDVEFVGGEATIPLQDTFIVTIEKIPAGYEYTVEEADYSKEGYEIESVTVEGQALDLRITDVASGTIESLDNSEGNFVDFVNHREVAVPTAARMGAGPFGILATAGLILLAVFRRRKRKTEM